MLSFFPDLSGSAKRFALFSIAALGLSGFIYISQAPTAHPALAATRLPPLAAGDWIFRSGTSSESYLIQSLSDSEFSHIGMVVSTEPQPMIVHATTDDDPQRANQVLISTLSEFIDPKRARSFAIARPRFMSSQDKQQASNWLLQQLQQPFILAERNTKHLYCTTLLADALRQSSISFQPQWQHINAPMFSGQYLFPSAFAHYPDIDWIYHSNKAQPAH